MPELFDELFASAKLQPFTPHYTPVQMMQRGVFGQSYFANATEEDFEGMSPAVEVFARLQVNSKYRPKLNQYRVRSGDSKEAWAKQGWLMPEDPLGWFHWYCRYDSGRRHQRDAWQIQRWQKFGERWGKFGRDQVRVKGWCSEVVKQSLLHWAYDPYFVLRFGDAATSQT